MAPTEHQKAEWVAAIKREYPRLAAQDFIVRAMVDVYAEDPGFISGLQKNKQKKKDTGVPKPQLPEDGVIRDAVKISVVDNNNTNAIITDADADAVDPRRTCGGQAAQACDRPPCEDPDAVSELGEHAAGH